MKNLTLNVSDTFRIELVYNVVERFEYRFNKPTTIKYTQCLLYINGVIENFSSISKHIGDVDNQELAYKTVTKKVLSCVENKTIRTLIWTEFYKSLN